MIVRNLAAILVMALVMAACASAESQATAAPTTSAVSTTAAPTTAPTTTTPVTTLAPTTPSTTTTEPVAVVRTGAGVLVDSNFDVLDGKRVGLIAHQNSVVDGTHLSDILNNAANVELISLFGPEHGVRGTADAGEYVDDATDPNTGVTVFSLFGPTRQPTPEMLSGLDVLVYDLQDVGARYYTYISTMGLAMQAAAAADIEFVVLDRPNPLGNQVGGGILEPSRTSFVGQYPIADVYGLTSAQLAIEIVENDWLSGLDGLDLTTVDLVNWDSSMRWADTGLAWIPPSPAITTPNTALLYPATIYFEATTLSYGRGTEAPFEVIGAPWLDADAAAAELTARGLPGVDVISTSITPAMLPGMTVEPAYLGQTVPAIQLAVTDHSAIASTELGVHLLEVVFSQARSAGVDPLSRPDWLDQLSGSTLLRRGIAEDTLTADEILAEQLRQRSEN